VCHITSIIWASFCFKCARASELFALVAKAQKNIWGTCSNRDVDDSLPQIKPSQKKLFVRISFLMPVAGLVDSGEPHQPTDEHWEELNLLTGLKTFFLGPQNLHYCALQGGGETLEPHFSLERRDISGEVFLKTVLNCLERVGSRTKIMTPKWT